MTNYTDAQIKDIIRLYSEGKTWKNIAKYMNTHYGLDLSEDACRKTYKRYENLFDLTEDKQAIELLKESSRVKRSNSKNTRQAKLALEALTNQEDLLTLLETTVKKLGKVQFHKAPAKPKAKKHKTDTTCEILLSDLHIGKQTDTFNLAVAKDRLSQFRYALIAELDRTKDQYNVVEIVVAMLGDMIENALMHDMESLSGSQFQNPEQVTYCIELLFTEIFIPLAALGIPMHVIGIAGNHDRQGKHKTYNLPGKHSFTWVIYQTLRLLCNQAGYTHLTWDIPEGVYTTYRIFGDLILFEHGDNIKGYNKASITTHIARRSAQIGQLIKGIRYGHVHEHSVMDEGVAIANASLPGQDSYSEINGYNSRPGQVITLYCDTAHRDNSFYRSFLVQLR